MSAPARLLPPLPLWPSRWKVGFVGLLTVALIGIPPGIISAASEPEPSVTVTVTADGGFLHEAFVLRLNGGGNSFTSDLCEPAQAEALEDENGDPTGIYHFSFFEVPNGQYRLSYDTFISQETCGENESFADELPTRYRLPDLAERRITVGEALTSSELSIVVFPTEGARIEILIVDEDNEPVSGLELVSLEPPRFGFFPSYFLVDDEDGRYVAENVMDGEYRLFIEFFDQERLWLNETVSRNVTVENGEVVLDFNPTIQISEVTIPGEEFEIIVINRVSQQPVPEVTLRLSHQESSFQTEVTTAASGLDPSMRISAVRSDLPSGSYMVESATPGFLVDASTTLFVPGEVPAPRSSRIARLQVSPLVLSGTVSGTVVGKVDGNKQAIEGVRVFASVVTPTGLELIPENEESESQTVFTDGSGSFTLGDIPVGVPVELFFSRAEQELKSDGAPVSDKFASTSLRLIIPVDHEGPYTLDEVLLPAGGRLQGEIFTSKDLIRLEILALSLDGIDLEDIEGPDGDGGFEIQPFSALPRGENFALVIRDTSNSASGEPIFVNGTPEAFSLSRTLEGFKLTAETNFIQIDLDSFMESAATLTINAAIQIGSQEAPVPPGRRIRVEIRDQEGDRVGYDLVNAPVLVNNSSLSLAGLAPGAYTLVFRDAGPTPSRSLQELEIPVVLTANQTTAIDARLSFQQPTTEVTEALIISDRDPTGTLDSVELGSDAIAGQPVTLEVGSEFAGQYVLVWANSEVTRLSPDWVQVDALGRVSAPIPAGFPTGDHRFAIMDADQNLAGWTSATVATPPASVGSTPPPSDRRTTSRVAVGAPAEPEEISPIPRSPRTMSSGVTDAAVEVDEVVSSVEPDLPTSEEEDLSDQASPPEAAVAANETTSGALLWWLVGGVIGVVVITTIVLGVRRASTL